jgi:uncharacterized protein YjcR
MGDIRKKGLETYLEPIGDISDSELVAKYGISTRTIAAWRKSDNWEGILTQTRQPTDKKIADKVSTSLVDGHDLGGMGGPLAVEYANPVNQGERGKGGSRVP